MCGIYLYIYFCLTCRALFAALISPHDSLLGTFNQCTSGLPWNRSLAPLVVWDCAECDLFFLSSPRPVMTYVAEALTSPIFSACSQVIAKQTLKWAATFVKRVTGVFRPGQRG